MKRAANDEQNLAIENVVGDALLSMRNRERRIRGVDKVRRGWTRE